MKKYLINGLFTLVFLTGLGIFAYPYVSSYYNDLKGSYVISDYEEMVSTQNDDELNNLLENARDYNQKLLDNPVGFELDEAEKKAYEAQLSIMDNSNMLGVVTIDKIKVELPIYQGSSEPVLQVGIGHLEGSSLPIGGKGNHSVIMGHRGLPTATLFTDLDKLIIGDEVKLNVLGESLSYVVKEIVVVEPTDLDLLQPVENKDLLTLITCTPYGVNSHRLLVICERVEDETSSPSIETNTNVKTEVKEEQVLNQVVNQDSQTLDLVILVVSVSVILIAILFKVYLNKRSKPPKN